jgi:hypothetical protein
MDIMVYGLKIAPRINLYSTLLDRDLSESRLENWRYTMIKILVNGKSVMEDTADVSYEHLRKALSTLLTTANIDAKGPQEAVKKLVKTAANLAKKPATDVIVVMEKPETKNAVEKATAEYTVKAVVNRINDALKINDRSGKIFKEESTGESTGTKQLADSADW